MNNLNVAKIQLNGDPYEINDGTNLHELLNNLKIQKNKVAVEVNGEIVEKNKYPSLILNKDDKVEIVQRNRYENLVLGKDDKVEIVHFIGGG